MTHSKLLMLVLFCALFAQGQSVEHRQILALVNGNAPHYQGLSKQIWDYAELGYHEEKSSALLQSQLRAAGFKVETPMPEMATAFVASYGSGKPVIGILGEFDALPGLSQQAVPSRKPVIAAAPGHGCGHNLFCLLYTSPSPRD